MNAAQLLAVYERIAEAPDAVARLRRFVLDLAVRGKLAPHDATDEPAPELLKRIARERARLVRAGEIRSLRELSAERRDLPFPLPPGWTAAPLDQLSPWSLVDGDWIETKDQSEAGNVRLIQLADVGVGNFLDKSARFITEATEVRLNCTRLVPGDILIARLPNPIGRACLLPDIGQPAITAVDVAILRPDRNTNPTFLVLALNAPPARSQVEAYGKGTTRFRVSTGHLKTVVLPIPPLAEQHRIVAKVDELMALCDRLEAARTAREATRDRLAAASLARLNTPDPETFPADARFALDALAALTTRPDQIKHLRQTILNLAVRGGLSGAGSEGGQTVDELLMAIRAEQAEIGLRIGRSTVASPPYATPRHWRWSTLGQLITFGPQNGLSPKPTNSASAPKAITLTATTSGVFDPNCYKHVEVTEAQAANYWLADGDLLFQRGNTREYVGIAAIYSGPGRTFLFPDLMIRVRISDRLSLPFIHLAAVAPPARTFLSASASGAQATMPKINQGTLLALPIPIPPRSEQDRIVATVRRLLALCDALERGLAETSVARAKLLEATLREAVQPATVPAMEAAE